ncbi:SRPBCC family protein [Metasolibacillus meyeri]|uniref:SRPBCC family protein n=1 Tax=Metasolibacillus meyeri TaxID=1071052 RepID=A0AAW9NML2_9BACL|nr:SRPBCC family protein [Metasolibacillus meyeri]MEC1177044.1 SRPBCC family protein [Metasolibacillus meyeri]
MQQVWSVLTENHHLQQWMGNLEIVDARKNGKMHFHMLDGTDAFVDMRITDYEEPKLFAFEWDKDHVRFELQLSEASTVLTLTETLQELTAHTPKDLAGWHICLQLFEGVLQGVSEQEFPMKDWEKYYGEYMELLKEM